MSERTAEEENDLDAYLRRRQAETGWEEALRQALAADLATKRSLKGQLEQGAIMGVTLRSATMWGGPGSPFLLDALTPGPRLGKVAARPFCGKWASQEAGIRASLLPDNPWFHDDAADVRRFLGLPQEGVRAVPLDQVSEEHWYWRELGHLSAGFQCNLWEAIHSSKAKGTPYAGPELPPFVPAFLRQYLVSGEILAVSVEELPEWLRAEPAFPWGTPPGYDGALPFHRFIANLLYHYGLPTRLFFSVRRYLFTAQASDLAALGKDARPASGLSPTLKAVRLPGAKQSSLTLTIQGIDAFTSIKELEEIWKALVEPAQHE